MALGKELGINMMHRNMSIKYARTGCEFNFFNKPVKSTVFRDVSFEVKHGDSITTSITRTKE
jgi:hypothetical protein